MKLKTVMTGILIMLLCFFFIGIGLNSSPAMETDVGKQYYTPTTTKTILIKKESEGLQTSILKFPLNKKNEDFTDYKTKNHYGYSKTFTTGNHRWRVNNNYY